MAPLISRVAIRLQFNFIVRINRNCLHFAASADNRFASPKPKPSTSCHPEPKSVSSKLARNDSPSPCQSPHLADKSEVTGLCRACFYGPKLNLKTPSNYRSWLHTLPSRSQRGRWHKTVLCRPISACRYHGRSRYCIPFAHARAAMRQPSASLRSATVKTAPLCVTGLPWIWNVMVAGRTTYAYRPSRCCATARPK